MAFVVHNQSNQIPSSKVNSPAATIIARQDRIPIWPLPYLFIGIIGTEFLFTLYFIAIGGFLIIAACLAQFGVPTNWKWLDGVSP